MKTELKSLFTAKELAPFYKKNNAINVLYLISLYGLSFSIIYFYQYLKNPFYIFFGIFIMGVVQHTLATFIHEAAHLNLFSNKRLNDGFGHFLCSAPLLSYLKDYRYFHFEHHRFTGKIDKDPELKFYRAMKIKPGPYTKKEIIKVFLNDFSGASYFRGLKYFLSYIKLKRKVVLIEKPSVLDHFSVLTWITIIPFIMWSLSLLTPFLIFWVAPILTLSPILLRWHGYGEHIREHDGCASSNTLTHQLSWPMTLFLYPINSSYHLEHHLYPQLPWHSLKRFYNWANKHPDYAEYSQKLTVDGFFFGNKSVISQTFPIKK
jgi:fatty acid desaturase